MKTTELPSLYDHLEKMSTHDILVNINKEDQRVALAVERAIPQIETLIDAIYPRMQDGGRVFYVGAGTSGRMGVLDASELPPTFGVSPGLVIGLIAGGDTALRNAVEHAEDIAIQGWKDIEQYKPTDKDSVIGIAASGTTAYVVGALTEARKRGMLTGCITSNHDTPVASAAEFPIEITVGPEFVTGSSRMKSGTAQKMILNMISTSLMIRMGRVEGNRMINMQLSNDKLIDRGTRMLVDSLHLSYDDAKNLLMESGSVSKALKNYKN